jgi:MFS family permease
MIQNSLLRAMAHRNFRLFFVGQSVSLIGTWMQQLALSWQVYLLTGSALWLGIVGFAGQIPAFFLAPLAGVVTDRHNRHRLIVLTQTLMMVQAFVLALLAWSLDRQMIDRWPGVYLIVGLSVFLGIVNVFDMTGRQAFLTDMVEGREDLANAIALNSSMFNGARLVGPALAGLLLAQTSVAVCFLANGLSYVAVIASLLAMRVKPHEPPKHVAPVLHGLREGIVYAFGFRPIRALLLLLALVSFMGLSYTVLLPIFADSLIGGGATTLGLLSAASGVGALVSAVYLAARKTILGLGRWIALAPAVFGLALLGFSLARGLGLALPMLCFCGAAMMLQMAASNTVLQTIVEEDKRGRVMSFYTMAFMGMAPLGSLLAGGLADLIGVQNTVRVGGVACIAGSVLFTLALPAIRETLRPIYRRMGILPEVASGIQKATELNVLPGRTG